MYSSNICWTRSWIHATVKWIKLAALRSSTHPRKRELSEIRCERNAFVPCLLSTHKKRYNHVNRYDLMNILSRVNLFEKLFSFISVPYKQRPDKMSNISLISVYQLISVLCAKLFIEYIIKCNCFWYITVCFVITGISMSYKWMHANDCKLLKAKKRNPW